MLLRYCKISSPIGLYKVVMYHSLDWRLLVLLIVGVISQFGALSNKNSHGQSVVKTQQ